jgi:hypothetical protein
MRQALPFLATIENDAHGMGTLAVILIRAARDFRGGYTDRLLTSDQQNAQMTD